MKYFLDGQIYVILYYSNSNRRLARICQKTSIFHFGYYLATTRLHVKSNYNVYHFAVIGLQYSFLQAFCKNARLKIGPKLKTPEAEERQKGLFSPILHKIMKIVCFSLNALQCNIIYCVVHVKLCFQISFVYYFFLLAGQGSS